MVVEVKTSPCPVCGAPYGFHDDPAHEAAAAAVAEELYLPKAKDVRAERRAQRETERQAWLARSDRSD